MENDDGNEVYYRLYLLAQTQLMTVVCMQWFDEPDYDLARFVRSPHGDRYRFETEAQAIEKLNEWYEPHQIEPEYRRAAELLNLVRP